MSKNMTKAELIAALEAAQAALQAQQAPVDAQEVELNLGAGETTHMDVRAGNFEPAMRGSRLAKNYSVTGNGLKSTSHSPKAREAVRTLNTLVQQFGASFKRTEARAWMFENIVTPGGEPRWTNELGVNTWLVGVKATILAEMRGLVRFEGKPETWAIDLHELALTNDYLNIS
jgi:hypothetical protein